MQQTPRVKSPGFLSLWLLYGAEGMGHMVWWGTGRRETQDGR